MHNRQLFDDLRALGDVRAPPRLLDAVLDEVELGDRYASLETALGPVFMAWNRRGAFGGHEDRHGRRIRSPLPRALRPLGAAAPGDRARCLTGSSICAA